MASVNKNSVRDELDRLKLQFEELSSEGSLTRESKMLMQSMLALLSLICAIFLEKNTTKTSDNSSKPSSQTDKDESALSQKGRNGKGKKEHAELAANTRVAEVVTLLEVTSCPICGEDLTHTLCHGQERRTKIDIVFEKVVEHVDAEIKACGNCGTDVKGTFPGDMPSPLQYGNGLQAYCINLLICQMVALNRVQKSVKTMIGVVISEATLLKFVRRLNESLADWELNVTEQLLNSAAINVDETSLRVERKNHWIHVYSSGDITLKCLHRRRGKEAIESINIIPRYGGVIIHDCWSSYLSYNHCAHGLCGSHLLRELAFVIDANGYRWAALMKRLLQETCKEVSGRE